MSDKPFDLVGDILRGLRFRGTIFFQSQLSAPWGMALTSMQRPRFHIAVAGEFFVGMDADQEPIAVQEMEAVMLPKGSAHWIADQPGRDLVSSAQATDACQLGNPMFQDGQTTNNLICGLIQFDEHAEHSLISSLPDVLHVGQIKENSAVWNLIEVINAELQQAESFDNIVVDRLAEVLFVKLLQEYIETAQQPVGFISALKDRRLAHALQLIHLNPHKSWTIKRLAEQVAMSSATLVRHFNETVGMAPMEYLSHWRLLQAHRLFLHTGQSADEICDVLGYASKASLTRAFKRQFGYTPASLRRNRP